jgi:hypothetical protein
VKTTALLAILVLAVLSGGCRQPDGVTPPLDEQGMNRISDLSRDLQSVARGEAGAPKDFADDLLVFVDEHSPETRTVVEGFAGRLAEAVASASLSEPAAEQLAHTSWMVVGATEMSDRQIRSLQAEFRSQLTAVGIPQDRADAVVAEVPTVQRAVTTRPRRWYEVL